MKSLIRDIIKLIDKHPELSHKQAKDLLLTAFDESPKPATMKGLRRTVTKPVLVTATEFMRNGKKVTRKAHRRSRPDRSK